MTHLNCKFLDQKVNADICISFFSNDRGYRLIYHAVVVGLVVFYTIIFFLLILILVGVLLFLFLNIFFLCWDIDVHEWFSIPCLEWWTLGIIRIQTVLNTLHANSKFKVCPTLFFWFDEACLQWWDEWLHIPLCWRHSSSYIQVSHQGHGRCIGQWSHVSSI